jgi:hypothetical protein
LVSDLSVSRVRRGEQRPAGGSPADHPAAAQRHLLDHPGRREGMLHPQHGMTDIGGEQVPPLRWPASPGPHRHQRGFPSGPSVCCGLTRPVPCPILFEQVFDNERGGMTATTPTTAPHPRPSASQAILAHQATPRHRAYTPAVLRALAHDQHRPPTTHVRRMLRDCPPPRGVRLTAATLHELAMDITGGPPAGSPPALAIPPLRTSYCATGWPGADPAHCCCPRTDRGGHVLDHAQPRDARHPARVLMWTPDRRAGQTGRDQLCFRAGMTRSTEVSEPNGDHQGRARSPPAPWLSCFPHGLAVAIYSTG